MNSSLMMRIVNLKNIEKYIKKCIQILHFHIKKSHKHKLKKRIKKNKNPIKISRYKIILYMKICHKRTCRIQKMIFQNFHRKGIQIQQLLLQ
jgi:hypothetical protein